MLINLRNALMAGKRRPYDAEIEFLESTGTQWIDTGYMLSGPTTFKLSASFTPTRDERDFFGAHAANAQGATVCGCYHNFVFGFNYPHPRIDGESLGSSEITTDIEYALGQSSRTLKVNGTTYSGSGAAFPNLAVTLFRGNENTAYYGQFKCYAFQIYDANGVLVRDFIPVRKGTVGYLYDRVSGKLFGNAGTGDFQYGQDVVPVEYIESHGTEYINAGFATTGVGLRAKVTCVKTTSAGSEMAVVGRNAVNGYELYFANGKCGLWNNNRGRSVLSDVSILMNEKYLIDANMDSTGASLTVNGTTKSASFTPSTPDAANVLLLRHSYKYYFVGKMCDCDLWNNDVLTRSFRPVRVGTDATSWEGAMMDVLTRRIYRNAGTGAFTYGNDLKYPIPAE